MRRFTTTLFNVTVTKPMIALFIIILLGSFLRLYRFTDFMKIDGDHGRDILIAKHIVEYGEGRWAAPYALGSQGTVKNSPVYYWLLAGMWSISGSTIGMGIVFALTSVITILIGYGAGNLFGGTRMGLTYAFFLSVSALLARDAHGVWPPFLLPLITVSAVYCMGKYIQNIRLRWLVLLITVLFLGVHIHQSFLPFFGVGICWSAWLSIRRASSAPLVLGYIFFHIMAWAFVTGNGAGTLREYSGLLPATHNLPDIFYTSIYRVIQPLSLLFPSLPPGASSGYLVIIISSLILLYRRHNHEMKYKSVLILFAGMLLYGLYGNNGEVALREYYFRAATIIALFILSYTAVSLLQHRLVYIGFVCLTGVLLNAGNERYLEPAGGGNYHGHYEVTSRILNDYAGVTRGIGGTSIAFYTRYLDAPLEAGRFIWSAAPQWYLAEDIQKHPLATIPEGYNNFAPPVILSKTVVYLTCVDTQNTPHDYEGDFITRCVDPFLMAFGDQLQSHSKSQEHTIQTADKTRYRTYRYTPESLGLIPR